MAQQRNNNVGAPIWCVQNEGSFASVHVDLPPGAQVCCESDAVVSFSQGVAVQGQLAGGFLGALARSFLTNESFFTTKVQNTLLEQRADVLMAPKEPGGIVLHRLVDGDNHNAGLLLTSGSYVASDANIEITSHIQKGLANSIFSGSGMFLLHARGVGTVACAAYGAVHAYNLRQGEVRAVDNGHLVAWTADMRYRTGWASQGAGDGGVWGNVVGSLTSGEGLACFFHGPGTVYVQSHKPQDAVETSQHRTTRGVSPVRVCMLFVFMGFVAGFFILLSLLSSLQDANQPHGQRNPRYQAYGEF